MHSHPPLLALLLVASALPGLGCQPPDGPFPDGFLWGTASAAWQAEGDYDPDPNDDFDVRSNWTVWTERGCVNEGQTNPEGSGFYTRYEDDFALAAELGNTSYRMTLDWTRIEPEDGQWNQAALDHYADVAAAATEAGLQPMVTFWHWVVPTWVQDPSEADPIDLLVEQPGPNSPFVVAFEDFVRRAAPVVAPHADLYSILNEPFSVIAGGYLNGFCGAESFPPGGLYDIDRARAAYVNLLFAQAAACRALREIDGSDVDGDGVGALCGQAATNNVVRPLDPNNPDDVAGAETIDWIYNHATMAALIDGNVDLDFDQAFTTSRADDPDLPIDEGNYPELAGSLDWQGVNYYGPIAVQGIPGSALGGLPIFAVEDYAPELPHSTLGFAIDSGGFGEVLDAFARYGLPLYITENGLGEDGDTDRGMFLVDHVQAMQQAIERGVDLRGYYHWSLTDNFEWAHGFEQRFGLFRVDFEDPALPRTRGAGADAYADVIAAGGVDDDVAAAWLRDRYSSDGRP